MLVQGTWGIIPFQEIHALPLTNSDELAWICPARWMSVTASIRPLRWDQSSCMQAAGRPYAPSVGEVNVRDSCGGLMRGERHMTSFELGAAAYGSPVATAPRGPQPKRF